MRKPLEGPIAMKILVRVPAPVSQDLWAYALAALAIASAKAGVLQRLLL